jgi:hypothetical protein
VLLLDLLSPPGDGYQLEHAVGTTFTLHLDALLRAPLAIAGQELREGLDPLGVMEAVRRSADRITVFSQAGMIAAPSAANRLLAFLEPVVHAVRRPADGHLFHPKIWLTAWTHPDAPRRFRFLCTSRNLTSDRAWDAVVGLDGVEGVDASPVNEPLADFVASLPDRSILHMTDERRAAVAALAAAVRQTEWTRPEGASEDWLRFHWLDRGRGFDAGPRDALRQLVVSPFVSTSGLAAVDSGGDLVLVSRPEHIAEIGESDRASLVKSREADFRVLDDAAALPHEEDLDSGLRWALQGLHAKVYVSERRKQTHLLLGSANATGAACAGNTEFLVELLYPRQAAKIETMLAGAEDSFGALLQPWNEAEPPPAEDPEQALEQTLVDLAMVPLRARATESASENWTLTLESTVPLAATELDGGTVTIHPITIKRAKGVRMLEPLELEWEGLEADQLTPFFVIELKGGPGTRNASVSTVVRASLEDGPEDRLDLVIARHVESPEAFMRFLMLLLQFTQGELLSLPDSDEDSAGAQWLLRMQQRGVLESVLHALAEQPEVIEEIERLVSRLETTEQGRARFPEGWTAFWQEVRSAHATLHGSRRRSRPS